MDAMFNIINLSTENILMLQSSCNAEIARRSGGQTEMKKIPFIALRNNDGKGWRENWNKCFDRPIVSEEDVVAGDKGSIGIGYFISTSLEVLLAGARTEKDKFTVLKATPSSLLEHPGPYSNRGPKSLKSVVDFYNFAQGDEVFFAIKRGTKGLWLAKKTSRYYHAPPSSRAGGCPLYSEHQNNPQYFEHRFCFEIVRKLTAEEALLPHHLQLIIQKTISVPA
jgi:hypothetical protein